MFWSPFEEKKFGATTKSKVLNFSPQGYEYFGYDPLTYFSNEGGGEEGGSFHLEDNRDNEELEIEEFDEEEKQNREPVLEIDLDEVENCKAEVRQGKDQGRDILCKWSAKNWKHGIGPEMVRLP